jgi:hypothetical protein
MCGCVVVCVVGAVIEAAEVLEAEAREIRDQRNDDDVWPMLVIVARFLRQRATGTRERIDWDAWGLE